MKEEPKICEVCGKPYEYQLQIEYKDGKKFCRHDGDCIDNVTIKRRHANAAASEEAMILAAKTKAIEDQTNPMVTINAPERGKQAFQIPEKVVESIKEKVAPEIETLLE